MITFSHVYKTYPGPNHALVDVNLKISRGEFIFLTGPSGAGKTTFFKLLSGFDKPTSGEVEVLGDNVNGLSISAIPNFRKKIGVIYQDFKLIDDKTVFENVSLPLRVQGAKDKYIQDRAMDVLNQVSLAHKSKSYPMQLSGGEQQRVAIARALIHHPSLLIADEPTGNLDPALAEEIMSLLEKVNAQGTTVFVATHDLEMVKRKNKKQVQIKKGIIHELL